MKKLLLLFAALLVAGCGEKLPNDPEIKQALKNAVWDYDLEWRDEKGLVTHEPQLIERSDGRRIYRMGYGIDRQHLRGESEPYSGWVKVHWPDPSNDKQPKDEEVVRMVYHVKGGHRDGPYKFWYSNGQMKEEGFNIAGKSHGSFKRWYKNGQKNGEWFCKDDKRDGLLTQWHENGQKWYEEIYKDGEEISAKYWNSRGEEVETYQESRK